MKQKKKSLWTRIGTVVMSAAMLCGMFCLVTQSLAMLTASAATYSDRESNDSLASASPFTYSGTVEGEISESDVSDFYAITLDKPGTLSINLRAEIQYLGFILYDENGNDLYNRNSDYKYGSNYRFGWNETSKRILADLEFDLNRGTYYLSLIKFAGCTGKYTVTTTFKATEESFAEPYGGSNNEMASANKMQLGKKYTGFLADYGDGIDFIRVDIGSSGNLRMELSANMSVLNFVLYDSEGNVIFDKGSDYKYGSNYHFIWNDVTKLITEDYTFALTKGSYYVSLSQYNGSSGEYNIKFSFDSANESFSETLFGNNNELAYSSEINIGSTYNGQIALNDDKDFYKFIVEKDSDINVYIDAGISTLGVIVYDANGNAVPELDRSGDYYYGSNFRLEWNETSKKIIYDQTASLKKGTYYICFNKFGGATGNYSFKISGTEAETVKLSKTSLALNKGQTATLTASVLPENTYDKTVTWTTSNSSVATVSGGTVKAVGAGTATITAKTANGKTATCKVTVTAPTVDVTGITLNKTTASVTKGSSLTLTATIAPTDATNKTVTWTSSNTSVATVSGGVVKGVAAGTATITAASYNGKTAACKVTVTEQTVDVTGITLNKTTASVTKGSSLTLTATIAPSNATNKTVTWTTSNSSVATVSGGVVKGVATGTATITAKTANGKTATCKVTVTAPTVDVTGITLNKTTASVTKGSSLTLTATIAPSNATNKTVTWTTSNSAVATVSGGVVKGVAAGTATITAASYNGKTAACKVTVTEQTVDVTGITLNKTTASVTKGSSLTLTATIAPSNATNKTVTWTTSNSAVATVSGGVVKGVAAGTATITAASYNGKTAVCKITVTENTTAFTLSDVKFSAYSINLGESITINCGAKNGTTPYQYAANYSLDGGTTTIQAYSETAKIKFTPSKAGTYKVTVKAKDAANKEVSKSYDVVVTDKVYTLTGASGISASTIQLGDKILLTAKAKGGTGFYKYAFYQRKSGAEDWKTIRAYGAEPAEYFKPGSTGKYEILIKVKDSKGSIVKSTFTLTVKASDKKIHLSASFDKTTVYAGEAVYVKAMATGGTGYYKYGFYFKKATDSEWTTAKAFSASNEAAFTLTQTGAYQVCVKVKDSNGATTKNYYDVTSSINTTAIKNNSTVSATTITLGNTVKMTASCTGGTGCYEYSMLYRLSGETEWSIIQSFGRNTTVNFKPEASGKYELNIKITDSQGSQTEKYFNLTVN